MSARPAPFDPAALEAAVRDLGGALAALQADLRAEAQARKRAVRQKARTGRLTATPSAPLQAPQPAAAAKPRDWVPEFLLQEDA